MAKVDNAFGKFAKVVSKICGSPWAFCSAMALVILWAVSGPLFGFSETWQLVINTGTTIITFLMVFIIQHTQNKDTAAMQIKLDELIRTSPFAHNALLDTEELSEQEIESIRDHYEQLARRAHTALRRGEDDKSKDHDAELTNVLCGEKSKPKTGKAKTRKKPVGTPRNRPLPKDK